jgi:hypothetical protein
MPKNIEEVATIRICKSCDVAHSYWFGKTCGECGATN